MTTGQAPIVIKTGNALDVEDTTSNVAVNQAELKAMAANIDGKDTYPQSVTTQRMNIGEAMTVGDQIQITDGSITANYLGADSVTTEKIFAGAVTASEMSVSTLSSISANLGTITSGSLSVGAGGVAIGSGSTGIGIINNVFTMVTGGVVKVRLDGVAGTAYFAGEVSASKFTVLENDENSVNFGVSVVIGGDIILNQYSASNSIYFSGSAASIAYSLPLDRITINSNNAVVISGSLDVAGTLLAGSFSPTSISTGSVTATGTITTPGAVISSGAVGVLGVHKTRLGSYKANGSFTFYAAASSGGSPTVLHTVTFTDGLITSWSAA